jgi:hypothetical protein
MTFRLGRIKNPSYGRAAIAALVRQQALRVSSRFNR